MPAAAQPSTDRLRQIAILVSSVDAATARQLLLHLPTDTAKRVRNLAARLGPITAEEKRKILSDFQKSAGSAQIVLPSPAASSSSPRDPRPSGAELPETPSESSTSASGQSNASEPPIPNAWTRLSIGALLRFVQSERPAVVAVVVSQLAPEVAVQLLQHLPHSVNRDVLTRLSRLQEIDREAMQAIDDYLSERLVEYQHKLESEGENKRRIQALLSAAPLALREQWERVFEESEHEHGAAPTGTGLERPAVPKQLTATSSGRPTQFVAADKANLSQGVPSLNASVAPGDVQASPAAREADRLNAELASAWTVDVSAADDHSVSDRAAEILPFRRDTSHVRRPATDYSLTQLEFEQILEFDPQRLAELLSRAEAKTVLLALAGATPRFMQRFYDLLLPSDAHALRDRLQCLGKIQLRDVDDAQRRIVELSLEYGLAGAELRATPVSKRSKQAA